MTATTQITKNGVRKRNFRGAKTEKIKKNLNRGENRISADVQRPETPAQIQVQTPSGGREGKSEKVGEKSVSVLT